MSDSLPPVKVVKQDDAHRLIPARYVDGDRSVLARLVTSDKELGEAFELDGATNDRLIAEAGGLPGISVLELVFGVPYAHIVNAAFTHPNPNGTRFTTPERGAWYAAFDERTCAEEVAYHKIRELDELPTWNDPELIHYVDFLADFHADLHDLRNQPSFQECLHPTDYAASQSLARRALAVGSGGIVYPSVRRAEGTCVVAFRPTLVTNVRRSHTRMFIFNPRGSSPRYKVSLRT